MNPEQRQYLTSVLTNAFDPDGFDRMLRHLVGKNRHDFVDDAPFHEIVYRLVDAAEREGWTALLITGALEANPQNTFLLEFVKQNPEYDPRNRKNDLWRGRVVNWDIDAARAQVEAEARHGSPEGLVFFCYSRVDQDFCLTLAQSVRDRGVPVWIDQWNIVPGADWDQSIDEALSKCDKVLIVLSPASVESDEVRTELRAAFNQKKPIVPVLYKKCAIPRRLSLIQHIDFTSAPPADERKVQQLLEAIRTSKK